VQPVARSQSCRPDSAGEATTTPLARKKLVKLRLRRWREGAARSFRNCRGNEPVASQRDVFRSSACTGMRAATRDSRAPHPNLDHPKVYERMGSERDGMSADGWEPGAAARVFAVDRALSTHLRWSCCPRTVRSSPGS
jgi:hypothetical protein